MKTLLAGCSLSDWCGFGIPLARNNLPALPLMGNHDDPRCWYNKLNQDLNLELVNVSYGGYSNEEILAQILKSLALDQFELVIIQLTSTQRKWFYRSNNPFEFILAHGVNSHNETEKKLFEYFRVNFNNELIEIERTLTLLLLIQNHLAQINIPLIILNGMNFGSSLSALKNNPEKFCRSHIHKDIWELKGKKYTQELFDIATKIKLDNFLFLDKSFMDLQIDVAEDNRHPGEKSNLLYASMISARLSEILQNP
jgi:hypothetical protein